MVASPWLGGSGTVGYTLAKTLARQGHKIFFVSYKQPMSKKKKIKNLHFENVAPYNYPLFPFPLYELALAEKIIETVKKHKISIIHAHYGIVFGYASLIAKTALKSQGIKVLLVTTFHGSDVLGFDFKKPGKKLPRNLNEWLAKSSDMTTVASNNLSEWVKKLQKIKKVSVVPNYIDTKTWKKST